MVFFVPRLPIYCNHRIAEFQGKQADRQNNVNSDVLFVKKKKSLT